MTIAVIGVGLIGGSIGLAARERLDANVRGFDPDPFALAQALELGAISVGADSLAEVLEGAEVAFVATPVGALPASVGDVLKAAAPECVVSDVGSTKRAIVAVHGDPRFVGGHPLAGAETSGVVNARADLFDAATWYLTPGEQTAGVLYERLHRTIHGLGAAPVAIEPARHDRMMAAVSHLPHVLANVLVAQVAETLGADDQSLPATGPSFRDAVRVAGANTAMWKDIYITNRDALIDQIDEAIRSLGDVRATLSAADDAGIARWNDAALDARRRLLEAEHTGERVHELRVSVPNEPGVVARLALALGEAGINIVDMALYPAPDRRDGVVALWVAGDRASERAQALVEGLGFPVARP